MLSKMNSYHVLELVGEGSYGRVYKGRKRFTGQVVALKFIPKVGRTDKELHNLKREIEIMRGLKHPNIVQMFDSFETEREVVVVTEYAEGDLFHILEDDGNLPENQVHEIACQLVSALYYLHSHRILHRDMKPQNILLGKGGVVKLCDFGFARAMSVSTLVLTSIKGTPLYMSPELVEEKPYDHTADLWSLGCILYELHTGAPPFYTNSIFHLVQLIVRDPVKWPDTMSQNCTSFLKGLLTKDPQKRLSWPELLHHPFVVDGVLVLSDCSAFSPLTVTPSPDMQALKLQQVAEKTAPLSGESRLLRKAREQRDNVKKSKQTGNTRAIPVPARTSSAAKPLTNNIPVTSSHSDENAVLSLKSKNKANETSLEKGQISTDYEREFPSVEVGPQLLRRCMEHSLTTTHGKDIDSELEWEKLAQDTDSSHQPETPNIQIIIPLLKNKFNTVQHQLIDGVLEGALHIHQPLKILRNLILTSDAESSYLIGCEVGLPQLLFDLVYIAVENSVFVEQPWSVTALGEMMVVLLTYWERHCDWVETEKRLEEFNKPFIKILNRPKPNPLLPLAASVLSMFTHHGVSVDVAMDNLIALVENLLCDSHKPQLSLPPGWGQCDGLLSLVLHALSEENGPLSSSIDSEVLFNMWCRIGSSLEETSLNTEFCSANGLYVFLSAMLFIFTKDPQSCVPLFSESASKCTYTLSHLLDADWIRKLSKGTPGTLWEDLSPSSFTVLGCHLLCFPFALDLPSKTMARILQSYDSCGIVTGLLQVIQTFPLALLELPLRLMGRLLLCDPRRSVPRLSAAAGACGFFAPPMANQVIASRGQVPPSRTASSLLSALLEADVLWDSAVELLNLLSQVARCSPRPASLQVHLESTGLQQALSHPRERIRAATCSLLGNINPFMPTTVRDTPPTLHPEMFKAMIDLLQDPCVPVRRMACRAVGNWLGLIGQVGFKPGRANGKGSDATGWSKGNGKGKSVPTYIGAGRVLSSMLKQGADEDKESRWIEEANRTTARLTPLITDHDVLTRRHCCSALGNLLNVHGGVSLLLKEDVPNLLLTVACTDDHHSVRQAAIATLCMCSREDAIRQVLMALGAHKSLLQASHHAPLQPDYGQLIALL